MKNFNKGKLAFGLALVTMLILPPLASAASGDPGVGGNGLKISPVRTDLTIQPGASKTVSVYVENVTSVPTDLHVIINDFTARGESGQPAIIINENQQAAQHSLKQFATTPPDFKLAPHQEKKINVKLAVPKGTAGGGYYGAVRFISADTQNPNKSVSVAASVGSLVLLRVPGNLDENLTVASFDVYKGDVSKTSNSSSFFTSNHSLSVVARFQNNGNIQEAPYGKVVLKKGDKTLETKEINNASPPSNVLPGSIRRFSVPLNKVGSWGKYTVEGNFGYGSSGKLLTVSKTFYVVPLALIIAVIVLIILIIIGIFLARKEMQRHDRKLLARFRSSTKSSKARTKRRR